MMEKLMEKIWAQHRKVRKNNKGFSMVELIIVIAIMAALIVVLAPQYIKYVERSRETADMNTVSEMLHAVQVAAVDPTYESALPTNFVFTVSTTGTVTIQGVSESNPNPKTNFSDLVASLIDVSTIQMKSTDGKALGTLTVAMVGSTCNWNEASRTAVNKLNDGVATTPAPG